MGNTVATKIKEIEMKKIELELTSNSTGKFSVGGIPIDDCITGVRADIIPGNTPIFGVTMVAREGSISADGKLVIDGINFIDEENERQVYELLKKKYEDEK
jgi:hypothetical protein